MWFSSPKPQPEAPFFAWSDADHSVGVRLFDQEHQRLAALLCKVHAALLENHDRALAQQLMETLIKETRAHFAHEEQVLADTGFSELEAHCAEHSALIQQAQDLLRQFLGGSISALALPVFLKNWLIPHIQGSDRRYAATLRRFGLR